MKYSSLARVAFLVHYFPLSATQHRVDAALFTNQRLSDTIQMFSHVNITGSICNNLIKEKGKKGKR